MKTIQTRFGDVEYDPDNLLHFPAGLIGFPTLHKFISTGLLDEATKLKHEADEFTKQALSMHN